ncbi:DUF6787 family protein [Rhodoflexus caldus]|uniref:DUF6787 family protein n=1 Tax=Rhodoflexus caldus TaxID=2891236 RepID=UPI002029B869|nr:DUF6787 family protein [Rhodoflexus caldus]
MAEKNPIERLKERWGVTSGWHVAVILAVFACTGFSILYLKKLLLPLLGIGDDSSTTARILASVFVILPLYQVVLLIYGFIFGQFRFFWEFEKKMFRRIAAPFRRKTVEK